MKGRILFISGFFLVVGCGQFESKKREQKEARITVKELPTDSFEKPTVIIPDEKCSFQQKFLDWYQTTYLTAVKFEFDRCDYSSGAALKSNYEYPDFPCAKDRICSYQFVSVVDVDGDHKGQINMILQTVDGVTQGHILDNLKSDLFMRNEKLTQAEFNTSVAASPDQKLPFLLATYSALTN